jgi:uncharacterized protein (TIGR01777 family)
MAWDSLDLAGSDAVVHLAGEPVAQRWTPSVRAAIHSSRVETMQRVAEAMVAVPREERPRTLIVASGVAIYGSVTSADETSQIGTGFLASVAREVEARASRLMYCGVRVVCLRIGQVVAPPGHGAPVVDAGLRVPCLGPGRLGSGEQVYSWISLHDLTRLILWALDGDVEGPVNATSPNPMAQVDVAATICRVTGRRGVPVPACVLRAMLGREAADEVALTGQRVLPALALRSGFRFEHERLVDALGRVAN